MQWRVNHYKHLLMFCLLKLVSGEQLSWTIKHLSEQLNWHHSWVINLDSVTILWLVRFDAWFDFLGPFLKNLASMSLPKIQAIFSRGHNQRWPPTPFWKIKFGTRASITLYKYIFSINSITGISNQISIWRLDFISIQNSKMAAIRKWKKVKIVRYHNYIILISNRNWFP